MREKLSPESHEPVEGINPFDYVPARRFGWVLLVWATAIWPFYILAAGLPLFGAHTLLVIASVIAYVVASARLIIGAAPARQSQYLILLAAGFGALALASEWDSKTALWLTPNLIFPIAVMVIPLSSSNALSQEPIPEGNARVAYILNFGLATWFGMWSFIFLRWALIFPTAEELIAGGRNGETGLILMFVGWILPLPAVMFTIYLSWTSDARHRSLRLMAISSAMIYLSLGAGSIGYVATTLWLSLRRFRRVRVMSGFE
ncbi:MAG: hypothetical protein HQ478_01570 [Chloroflexi bacterium]|nr:hypothetical protein [Chloroflexota bacterium]